MKRSYAIALGFATILGAGSVLAGDTQVKTTTASTTKVETKTVTKKEDQAALKKEAKISMEKAREIAVKKAPGKVESSELEREHGKLIYSFDIRNSKGTIDEVNVSAIDGSIVAVEHENKAKEAAEKKQEAAEKTTTTKH